MTVKTKLGELEQGSLNILEFPNGVLGFPDLRWFALVKDEKEGGAQWLVSLDDPAFALPVTDPLAVEPGYSPSVEEEVLANIGPLEEGRFLVLATLAAAPGGKEARVNLGGPIIINLDTMKGAQASDAGEYSVKVLSGVPQETDT